MVATSSAGIHSFEDTQINMWTRVFSIHYVRSRQNKKKTFAFSGGHKRSSFDGRAWINHSSPLRHLCAQNKTKHAKTFNRTIYSLGDCKNGGRQNSGVRHLIGTLWHWYWIGTSVAYLFMYSTQKERECSRDGGRGRGPVTAATAPHIIGHKQKPPHHIA